MRKSHLNIFLYFTIAVLAFSVLIISVTADETTKKSKSSKPTTESSSKSTDTNVKVDLNSASEKDLESLPGVGSATAKKIIARRPYSSVEDLSKAGLSAATIKNVAPLVTVSGAAASTPSKAATTPATPTPSPAKPTKTADANVKVDLNTGSEKDLESLPGVGSATAKKIMAGRPYSSVDDLSKAGVSASTIKKVSPLVTVSSAAASAPIKAASTAATPTPLAAKPTKTADANAKVNLNTGSEKDLESLPGVGPATAKKIIAGRPYSSVDDLSKAGVSASTIKKIAPLVMISGSAATAASTKTSAPAAQPSPATPSQPVPASQAKATASSPSSQGAPGPGMVWVNLSSGIYHHSGSQFYGKTKNGKYMSEDDAIKAGYHAAKNEKKPQ